MEPSCRRGAVGRRVTLSQLSFPQTLLLFSRDCWFLLQVVPDLPFLHSSEVCVLNRLCVLGMYYKQFKAFIKKYGSSPGQSLEQSNLPKEAAKGKNVMNKLFNAGIFKHRPDTTQYTYTKTEIAVVHCAFALQSSSTNFNFPHRSALTRGDKLCPFESRGLSTQY